MSNIYTLLPACVLGVVSLNLSPALASECQTSYYCYGETAQSIAGISTRPPPIAPPNRRVSQQRQHAQLAARGNQRLAATPPRPVTPAPQPRPQRLPPPTVMPPVNPTPPPQVAVPQLPLQLPDINQSAQAATHMVNSWLSRVQQVQQPATQQLPPVQHAPRPLPPATVMNRRAPAPRPAPHDCVQLSKQVDALERQAIQASRQNQRDQSRDLFREAAQLRQHMQHCRR